MSGLVTSSYLNDHEYLTAPTGSNSYEEVGGSIDSGDRTRVLRRHRCRPQLPTYDPFEGEPPQVGIEGTYDPDEETVELVHAGGDRIDASNADTVGIYVVPDRESLNRTAPPNETVSLPFEESDTVRVRGVPRTHHVYVILKQGLNIATIAHYDAGRELEHEVRA